MGLDQTKIKKVTSTLLMWQKNLWMFPSLPLVTRAALGDSGNAFDICLPCLPDFALIHPCNPEGLNLANRGLGPWPHSGSGPTDWTPFSIWLHCCALTRKHSPLSLVGVNGYLCVWLVFCQKRVEKKMTFALMGQFKHRMLLEWKQYPM